MIKKRTVFVLGAGASVPYGFPTGGELVDHICAEILISDRARVPPRRMHLLDFRLPIRLADLGYSAKDIQEFASAMYAVRPYSVDTFLEMRPAFKDIGKAAIADVLLRAETKSLTVDADAEFDWYRYLLNNILLRRSPEFFSEQVKFLRLVTFNFDRSLERWLFDGICHGFGQGDDASRSLLRKLHIHHVHGRLGKPDWIYHSPLEMTPYGATDGQLKDSTEKAVRSMNLVHEPSPEKDLEKAREALKDAEVVNFIGFGFDERNLLKLRLPECVSTMATLRATTYGLQRAEHEPLYRLFSSRLKMHEVDACSFLRQHAFELFD